MNVCYILRTPNSNLTYNGYTCAPTRRLRQHNGELVGGAAATRGRGPWQFMVQITSADPEFDRRTALSLEWHVRYPTCRRPRPASYNGPLGRIRALPLVFAHPKFAHMSFEVLVDAAYAECAATVLAGSPNVTVTK